MSNKKIEFAPAIKVEGLLTEVDELLRQLALLLKDPEESEDDWLDYVFVSDESRISDFLHTESELAEIRERLELPELKMRDLISDAALALRNKKSQRTIQ